MKSLQKVLCDSIKTEISVLTCLSLAFVVTDGKHCSKLFFVRTLCCSVRGSVLVLELVPFNSLFSPNVCDTNPAVIQPWKWFCLLLFLHVGLFCFTAKGEEAKSEKSGSEIKCKDFQPHAKSFAQKLIANILNKFKSIIFLASIKNTDCFYSNKSIS